MIKSFVRWFLRRRGINLCHLCDTITENTLGDKLTCYGCEHEVMGYDNQWDAHMEMLYGDVL